MLIRCPWRLLLPSILVRRCISLFYHRDISEGGRELGGEVGRRTGFICCADAGEDDEADYAHETDTDHILVSRGISFLLFEGGAEERNGWTDKVATLKMPVKRVICNFDVLSRQRTGMGLFDVVLSVCVNPLHIGGKYHPVLTRAKMKKSRTALIEPVEMSILMISTHLPFIGGGLPSTLGPNQNRRTGVLG